MSFNGSGIFTRNYSWTTDAANGVLIRSDRMDADTNDIASGLTNTVCKDGQSTTSAVIPFSLGIKVNDGSVSAPALTFTSETSSGLYRISAGSIGLSAAGTNAATFTSAGITTPGLIANLVTFSKGTDIASASTTPIGAATGNYVNVTGITTITAFDTIAAGAERIVTFAGILILTHNATSLILPGAANITTAAGDTATFISLGSGNWKCTAYQVAASAPGGGFTASSTATLTNKTYDTAGTGNVFKINGTAVSAVTGTGAVVLASSPTLVTPALGAATATTPTALDSSTKVATTAFVSTNTQTAKAWCTFDGTLTGTNAPAAGFNVTSVTRNSTGNYTLNFTASLANANYAVTAMGGSSLAAHYSSASTSTYTFTLNNTANDAAVDSARVSALVFGT